MAFRTIFKRYCRSTLVYFTIIVFKISEIFRNKAEKNFRVGISSYINFGNSKIGDLFNFFKLFIIRITALKAMEPKRFSKS